MDTREFGRKLKKISVLFDTIQENGAVSNLEKDLLLSYIRDLYEVAADAETSQIRKTEIPVEKKAEVKINENITPVTQIPEERPVIDLSSSVPVIKTSPKAEPVVESVASARAAEPEAKSVASAVSASAANTDQAVLELFQEAKVTDLSDKLAQTPIKDLTKAMGINEKIFTMQELFGNNQEHFNKVLTDLNNCPDYSTAKTYLMEEVIPRYNWTSDNKIKKAVTFVRMVRRRFVS
ncbi:MAG: hypothetical protein IPM26_11300 [Saprospiraceae bacterium]|nr:hypothetical protein [Saprospiraceae bacterium]